MRQAWEVENAQETLRTQPMIIINSVLRELLYIVKSGEDELLAKYIAGVLAPFNPSLATVPS